VRQIPLNRSIFTTFARRRIARKPKRETFTGGFPRTREGRWLRTELLEDRRLLAAGALDATFGTTGLATAAFPSQVVAQTSAIEPDGKLLVAGGIQLNQGSPDALAVARFNADGTPDTTFGTEGTVVLADAGTVQHIVVEPDGGILLAGLDSAGGGNLLTRLTDTGAVDATFGKSGAVSLPGLVGASIVLESDGKIVAVGDEPGKYDVVRLQADGSFDPTFGTAGVSVDPMPQGSSGSFYGVADAVIQPDGSIVTSAMVAPTSGSHFELARFTPDGALDTTFGDQGTVETPIQIPFNSAETLALESDGKILLAGSTPLPPGSQNGNLALVRYNSDGTPDATFGTNGEVTMPYLGWVTKALLEPNGRVVLAGTHANVGNELIRLNADGTLDDTFGTGGVVDLGYEGIFSSVVEQADGRYVFSSSQSDAMIAERFFGENPVFTSGIADVTVAENSPATVISLPNDFRDGGVPATPLIFSITADSNPSLFSSTTIDPQTGNLTLGYAPNQSGIAQLTVRATDPGGAYVEASFHAAVLSATPQADSWISTASGFWDVASNWSRGVVPATGDSVVIDQPGVTVTVGPGDAEVVSGLTTAAGTTLAVTGGTLTITGNSTLSGALTMTGGLFRATSPQISVNVAGACSIAGGSLDAENGATLTLPTLSSYQNPDPSAGTSFQANGSGSTLDLSGLTSLGAMNSMLSVTATGGGRVVLSSLGAIQNSSQTPNVIQFSDDGTGSQIDLSALTVFDGGDNSALYVTNHASLLAPLLSTLGDVQAILDGADPHVADTWLTFVGGALQVTGGSYDLPKLTDVDRSSLLVASGGTLALPNVKTYVAGPADFFADGAGSVLDLSSLDSVSQQQPTLSISATNGGEVNLDSLTSLSGSIINDKGNSRLLDSHLTEIDHTFITLDGTDAQVAASWTEFVAGSLFVTGGSYDLPQLTDVDGSNVFVQGGGRLALPGVNQLSANQGFLADGAGSLLDLSNLSSVAELQPQASLGLSAMHGGELVLTRLTSLKGGDNSINFADIGNSKVLDPNLTSLTGATIWLDGTDPDVAAAWTTIVDGRLMVQGGAYTLTRLTSANLVYLSLSGGASLTLPGVLNLAQGNSLDSPNITLDPGTNLDVGGGFTETPTTTMVVQIGGTPASGQFGRLTVSGAAVIGGTLNVALVDGFVPQENEDFKAMTFAGLSGNFTTVTGLSPNFSLHTLPQSLDITTALHDTIDSLRSATVDGIEGATLQGALATFTEANPLATPDSFTATIDWGDGVTSAGTVTATSSGSFTVVGSHVYAEEGENMPVTVVIDGPAALQATATSTASVSDAKLHIAPGTTVAPSGGLANNLLVASFTDDGGPEAASDYSATIDWGDGATTAGSITWANGVFDITGSHQYARAGAFTVGVSVSDEGGSVDGLVEQAAVQLTPHQQYVIAVYQDVLGRAPDPDGLAYWSQQLDSGAAISNVAQAIVHSDEYYANFVIKPDYLRLFARSADPAGIAYWTGKMDTGTTDQEIEADLVSSGEFYQHAGGNTAWIDAVYALLLGRSADPDGEAYWNGQLAAGQTLNDVAQRIASSAENSTQLINADYFHYLGRTADPVGLTYWLKEFAAGQTNEDVIAGFTGSAEYYTKHTS
jgi:uncharacterized delta-60 repeat protein